MNEIPGSVEKREGATPNGGVRSEAYYTDDNWNPVEKAKATRVEIVEIDTNGKVIARTHGNLSSTGQS